MIRLVALLLGLVVAFAAPPSCAQTRGPLVLAAASLQESLTEAAGRWAAKGHPKPVLSFAASSALARQIAAGAQGDSVRSALALVERREAPFGIVYATDARASKGVRVVGTFPAASHPPITYPVALLRQSTHRDADGFRRFLLSREGRAIFARYGFPARQGSNK